MPATRIRHLSPTADFLGPWSGKPPTDLVPAAHVIDWLQDARRRILAAGGTDQEANSLMVAGGSALALTYTDELTEIEQARDELAAWRALGQESREWIGREGESRVSQADFRRFVERMSALLGNPLILDPAAVGTQGPAAGPVTPNTPTPPAPEPTDEERRGRFRAAAAIGGWALPEQARDALTYVRQMGWRDLTAAEVERWEGLPVGSLGA